MTCVVSSLVQVIMDDRFRHIEGLLELIDREWMLGGHEFTHGTSFGWLVFCEALNHLFAGVFWRYKKT